MKRITLQDLKELRDRTTAGVLACRAALETAEGDMARAEEILREKARREAAKRESRAMGAGLVASYVHHTGRLGALVELTCETDFVARTDDFEALARHAAEQVAATAPGTLEALLAQPWIRDGARTVGDLVREAAGRLGENVQIRRFSRLDLAEEA